MKATTIGLLGLPFKPNTDALGMVRLLTSQPGYCRVVPKCGSMMRSRSVKLVASAQNPVSKSMIPGSAWPQMQTR